MDQKKIGEFLKELRKEKGITQEQAAEQFGVAQRTISRWETGSNMPDISMLIEIAEFYNADVREIIDGERKSEIMNSEVKETLEKVVDYNDAINAKANKVGMISMLCVFMVLTMVSLYKGTSTAPLVSMICAYNGALWFSKAKQKKDKADLFVGVLFVCAAVVNILAYIVS